MCGEKKTVKMKYDCSSEKKHIDSLAIQTSLFANIKYLNISSK